MRTFDALRQVLIMLKRRLDDRIRDLCVQVCSVTTDGDARTPEVEALLQELLGAIHEKVLRLRTLAAQKLLTGGAQNEHRQERRADHA
jgi:hypothetical protein